MCIGKPARAPGNLPCPARRCRRAFAPVSKSDQYRHTLARIEALIEGESDEVALMATIATELHHGLEHFHWTGFYRHVEPQVLKVGPYQGGHGCLRIPFEKGVCGKCARDGKTQIVADVEALPYHIACSSSTRSEIVVPVFDRAGQLRAVLDVDSDEPGAFDETDAAFLEDLCRRLGAAAYR